MFLLTCDVKSSWDLLKRLCCHISGIFICFSLITWFLFQSCLMTLQLPVIPLPLPTKSKHNEYKFTVFSFDYSCSCSVNWESHSFNATTYIVFLFIFGLLVPVIVIVYSYVKIIRTMRENSVRSGRVNKVESRVTSMIFVMIIGEFQKKKKLFRFSIQLD